MILRPLVERVEFTFGFFAAEGSTSSRGTQKFFDLCEETLFELIPGVRRIDDTTDTKTRD